ncbi:MAG TPA: amidohydrolase family protein [Devosiaceae bacterium]|jgi:aminocarboxymuconate-semialdehyde decarboxylase
MTFVPTPYGPTAARTHGLPGRETRPSTTTVDMHTHVWSVEAAALANQHLEAGKTGIERLAVSETKSIMAKQVADRRPLQIDWRPRLVDMDAMGIDIQVLTPVPAQMYQGLPRDVAIKAATIVNDNIAALAANRPDRFVAIGAVPLEDMSAAVEELERGVRQLGLKGVQIPTNLGGREISGPDFAPFWAKAEALEAVVFIHPTGFTQPERLTRFYLNNTIGNPLETTIALHYLILDGVLERHPELKVVASHGGAFAAAYSGRMDHAWGARSDAHGELPNPPSSYLRRVYFDSIVFSPHQLEYLVRTFGADHVMVGTDYPADMGEYDPLGHLAAVASFTEAERGAIAGGNAKRLYNIA